MKTRQPLWICLLLLLHSDVSLSANVLAIFHFPGMSNFIFNKGILDTLHRAGHQITFLTPFASKAQSAPNFTVVDIHKNLPPVAINAFSAPTLAQFGVHRRMQGWFDLEEKYCQNIMEMQVIQDALSSKVKFDVILSHLMFIPHCTMKIAEVLNLPVIGTIVFRREFPNLDSGNPLSPSVFPHTGAPFDERMTFAERLANTWYYVLTRIFYYTTVRPKAIQFCQTYFPESPTLPKVAPALVFIDSHSSVLARPLVPNFIEVAGIHIGSPKPLHPPLQKFIDEADQGVILFSLGSVASPHQFPRELISALVEVFASIPQRVVWKYDAPLEVSANVLLASWIAQRDILEHKNVIAFISHCGLSSMLEAIHTETPVVAVPFFVDQPSNAQFLCHTGAAVHLPLLTASKEQILAALTAITNDKKYRENMSELARRFKDRPMTPEQTVVYWTEYVLRYEGAAHLRSTAADMPFYQYLLLDVILFVSAVIATLLYLLYLLISLASKLWTKAPSGTHKKTE